MKRLTCAVVGYGDRGGIYCRYALEKPEELELIAAVDPSETKREEVQKKYSLKDEALFASLEEFLESGIKCDFVINATMDELHYETSVALLKKGYNLLLEKPITSDAEKLLEISNTAKANGCKIVVCHVLRYTPFYSTVKKIIDSGEIGEVVNLQMNEHIGVRHFINSYVRGKWRSEKACGSGLLLAKCCHDIDLLCWMNNKTAPEKVTSFGSKSYFNEANAPKGSTKFCADCPHKTTCRFEAESFEIDKGSIPYTYWYGYGKPLEEITPEEKKAYIRDKVFGTCVYRTDMDIVDRQSLNIRFENGSTATFNVVGCVTKANRFIHAVCTLGEVVGYVGDNFLTVRYYDEEKASYTEKIVDFNAEVDLSKEDNSMRGHYGGDYRIMVDTCKFFRGEPTSVSTTVIEDSVSGHMLCYAADEARKNGCIVEMKEFYERYDKTI